MRVYVHVQPFRALTNAESPNLLVAGKSMSQSFWANAATRCVNQLAIPSSHASPNMCLLSLAGFTPRSGPLAPLQAPLPP
jgi:hypothetical protein